MQGSCAREDAPWLNRKIRRTPNSRPVPLARFRGNSRGFQDPLNQANPLSRASPVLPVRSPANQASLGPLARFPVNLSSPAFPARNNLANQRNLASPDRRVPFQVNPANLPEFVLFLQAPSRPLLLGLNHRFLLVLPAPRERPGFGRLLRLRPVPSLYLLDQNPRLPPE